MRSKLVIDLGSCYTKIYKAGADVVLSEPTLIAINAGDYKRPAGVGKAAAELIGKTTEQTRLISPVSGSDIVDKKALVVLLTAFLKKIKEPFELKPSVYLCVNLGITREQMADFEEVFNKAGVYDVNFIESPILSAISATETISENRLFTVIDLGGVQTTIAALTVGGGVISGLSARLGGNDLTRSIITEAENSLNLSIGFSQAEAIKLSVASFCDGDVTKAVALGKDAQSGKTRSLNVSAADIYPCVKAYADKVINLTRAILQKLPKDLDDDIVKYGVVLTGGGSKIYGIDDYFSKELNLRVTVLDEGELSAVTGGGIALKNEKSLPDITLKF